MGQTHKYSLPIDDVLLRFHSEDFMKSVLVFVEVKGPVEAGRRDEAVWRRCRYSVICALFEMC